MTPHTEPEDPMLIELCLNCEYAGCYGVCEKYRAAAGGHGKRRKLYTHNGRTMDIEAWADELGVTPECLRKRMHHMSFDEAVTLPFGAHTRIGRRGETYTAFGKTQTFREWAEEYGINYMTLKSRLNSGMKLEKALTAPVKPIGRHKHGKDHHTA